MGISIVSGICLTGNEKLAAIPLNDYFPQRSYGVVMRRSKFLSPQAKSFLEMMDPDFRQRYNKGENGGLQTSHTKVASGHSGDFTGHDKSLP